MDPVKFSEDKMNELITSIRAERTWLQKHERLIIIALVLGVGYFGFSKWVDRSAADAMTRAAVAQQIASVQHDADVKIAAAIAQQTALFDQQSLAREKEMASLAVAIASRDNSASHQIAVVTQPKTQPQAIADLNTVYKLPTPLTVEEAGSIPTADIQLFTVAKIEAETAKADLTDTKAQLLTTENLLKSATDLVIKEKEQVAGLQTELKTQADAAKVEIASVKALDRKSKVKWFKIGFVAGFISRQIVKTYTGW